MASQLAATVAPPPVKLAPTISIPKNLSSLKETLKAPPAAATEETAQEEINQQDRNQAFTQEAFAAAWLAFAQSRKEMGKDAEYTVLNQEPELNDLEVIVKLSSSLQEHIFEKLRNDLSDYLRNTLNNFGIQLRAVLEEDTSVRKPYTQSDRYAYLAEKNPMLALLKDRLGLDPDF